MGHTVCGLLSIRGLGTPPEKFNGHFLKVCAQVERTEVRVPAWIGSLCLLAEIFDIFDSKGTPVGHTVLVIGSIPLRPYGLHDGVAAGLLCFSTIPLVDAIYCVLNPQDSVKM